MFIQSCALHALAHSRRSHGVHQPPCICPYAAQCMVLAVLASHTIGIQTTENTFNASSVACRVIGTLCLQSAFRTACCITAPKMFRAPAVHQAAAIGRRTIQRSIAMTAGSVVKSEEVLQAQADGQGVVALESTIISHGENQALNERCSSPKCSCVLRHAFSTKC